MADNGRRGERGAWVVTVAAVAVFGRIGRLTASSADAAGGAADERTAEVETEPARGDLVGQNLGTELPLCTECEPRVPPRVALAVTFLSTVAARADTGEAVIDCDCVKACAWAWSAASKADESALFSCF
jgi:hypothetical protein